MTSTVLNDEGGQRFLRVLARTDEQVAAAMAGEPAESETPVPRPEDRRRRAE